MNDQVQDAQVQPGEAAKQDESNDAFDAAFSKVREGVSQPQQSVQKEEGKQEAKPESTPTEPAPEPAAKDEWDGVSPKVKAELESISAAMRHLSEERLRPFEGRWKQMQQVVNEWNAAKAAGTAAAAPSKEQQAAATVSSEKWNALKEDFPEWAEAMEERLAAMQAAPTQAPVDLDKVRAEIRQELESSFDQRVLQASRAAVGAVVELKYPNWTETVRSEEFKAWRAKQPAEVNALGASESAKDAIKMLDLFTEARKKSVAAEARLKQAQPAKGVPVISVPESEDDAFNTGFSRARGGG